MSAKRVPEGNALHWLRRRSTLIGGGMATTTIVTMSAIYYFFFALSILERAVNEFEDTHPQALVSRDQSTGYAITMSNLEATTAQPASGADAVSQAAVAFLSHPAVAANLAVPATASLQVVGRFADPQLRGFEILRVEQFVEGVRLFGADIALSMRSGPTVSVSTVASHAAELPAVRLTPAISEAQARESALAFYGSLSKDPRSGLPAVGTAAEVERIIFDPKRFRMGGDATLAWRVRVASVQTFVDAQQGRVIAAFDDRHVALNRRTHDCANTFQCPAVLIDSDPVPPGTKPGPDARFAHDAAEAAHAYFRQAFGRDGFDDVLGQGGKEAIESHVRVSGLANAQWLPVEKRFEYGDGWIVLDIAGHEYTHAVTQFGPDLKYFGESGAVNEFFSDFFSLLIDRSKTGTLDWRIGEGVRGFSAAKPMRNMATPHNGGFDPTKNYSPGSNSGQPEHFKELVTTNDKICSSTFLNDNGCVHFNSGILNKAMHLTLVGQGTAAPPLPVAKLEQIMFRTLMLGGVTQSSGLKETAEGVMLACNRLATPSQFGITAGDCTALEQAFKAVGLK